MEQTQTRNLKEVQLPVGDNHGKRAIYLRQFGDFTLAYGCCVQPILQHYESQTGWIAFGRKWGFKFALGDPVCAESNREALLGRFLDAHPRTDFVQCSSDTAACLSQHGYYVNEMGYDTHLPLHEYNFAGKSKEKIRYAYNWLTRRDYIFFEIPDHSIDQELKTLSDAWRKTRRIKSREVVFLNRPFSIEDPAGVRKFGLRGPNGELVAFAFFDPLFRDGKVIGYTTVIKRRHPDAPTYAETGLVKYAIEQFKSERMELVTLGLSPLAGIENKDMKANPILHHGWKYGFGAWWVNRFFYNLRGHSQYKNHFHGEQVKTYYCSRALFCDVRIFALLRLMRVV